jgi:Icc-related predicted phosphoesterase
VKAIVRAVSFPRYVRPNRGISCMSSRLVISIVAVLFAVACKKEAPAPAQPAAVKLPAPPTAPPNQPAEKPATFLAAQSGRSEPECVGPIDLAVPEEVKFGKRAAELNGFRLTFKDKDPAEQLVFGVLANINEDSGENIFNIKRYLEFFKKEGADAIIVDGDTGESAESIERALKPLAETGLPTFVVIGNRECKGDFNDAMLKLQKSFPNVINLGRVRYVEFEHVALVSLPGYHDRRYIHCATGCQYFKQDLDALGEFLGKRTQTTPVVLVTHGPPKGDTPNALDAATEVGNVGDPALNDLIQKAKIPFGIFSNIKEAGARATDLTGTNVIKEDVLADTLYMNPGPADSLFPWALNDGTTSNGMAGVLVVKGKQAKFKMYRAKPLTQAEKALAQKLAPPKASDADEDKPAKAEGAAQP